MPRRVAELLMDSGQKSHDGCKPTLARQCINRLASDPDVTLGRP
jgi:hypothetical protein